MTSILIRNATILNPGATKIQNADIQIQDNRITKIEKIIQQRSEIEIDATDKVVIPGFIQTHVHLCQALFRGTADDLELLDWLRTRTWPIEAAHDHETTYYSGLLGCMELIRSGTTCIADMGSIRNADADAQAMFDIGIRGKFGKAMTDLGDLPSELGELPTAFSETTQESIDESIKLLKKWHHKDNDRIQYLFAPRGILSTSEELLLELKHLAEVYDSGIHTHACENKTESERVYEQRGANEIKYLNAIGLTGENLLLAHCVWVDEQDIEILSRSGTKVLHCPSANLKLASGIAPIPSFLEKDICVSIGADGAPCNNNLDAFVEMRLAALIQKGLLLNPVVMPASVLFEMATINGARTLGLENEIGSIEVGKKADLVILDLNKPHSFPHTDLCSAIVYSAGRENVETVIIDGKLILKDKEFVLMDELEMMNKCKRASMNLFHRAGLL